MQLLTLQSSRSAITLLVCLFGYVYNNMLHRHSTQSPPPKRPPWELRQTIPIVLLPLGILVEGSQKLLKLRLCSCSCKPDVAIISSPRVVCPLFTDKNWGICTGLQLREPGFLGPALIRRGELALVLLIIDARTAHCPNCLGKITCVAWNRFL